MLKDPCSEAAAAGKPYERSHARDIGHWVLAATIIGSSMSFIDGSVVNIALPRMQTDMQATVAGVQWVVEAYALFLSAFILTGGSLGDRLGRRRIFAAGIAVFTLASVWCGLAPNIGQLVAARAVQGFGGALLVPGSLAIIGASFGPQDRGRAIGTWSAFSSITTVMGPVLGGWLVEHASWRAVFFINLPLSLIVLLILFSHVPESRDEAATGHIDWAGSALATMGLGLLVYGLIRSADLGLNSPQVLVTVVAGAGILVAFVFVEARSPAPMMPLELFRSRTFTGANLLTLLLYGALAAALFFLPFNLLQVQGYSPTAAGAAFLPFSLLLFLLSRWSGGLVDRYGARLPLVAGPLITALGFGLLAVPGKGGSYWTTFFPGILLLGLGMAVTVAPLTTAVMGAADPHVVGAASGINNAVSRTAGLLAIAVLGIVMLSTYSRVLERRLAEIQAPAADTQALVAQRTRLAAAEVPAGASTEMRSAMREAVDDAFLGGFRVVTLISGGLAAGAAASAWALIDGKPRKRKEDRS